MKKTLRLAASALALAMGATLGGEAFATEGYFQHAYGLRHKALAGAGAASIEDGTGISINPAGLVGIGDQLNLGLSLFMPVRGAKVLGDTTTDCTSGGRPAVPCGGDYKSRRPIFPIPTLAYVRQLDADSAIAFSIFGNGGMNTTYSATEGVGGKGVFRDGKAGVDLMQMFISAAYAQRYGNLSIGIAPLFAIQRFKAYGLGNFAPLSTDPNNLTNRGYSYSYGAGARFGIMYRFAPDWSFGASFQTPMWMTRFKKYAGLFAERGDFDIPANLQVGLAWQASEDLKLMLDYRHIFYSGVKSISNRGVCSPAANNLGADDGCGFDWRDTNTIKFGVEYQANENLILRAGYAYTFPNPIRDRGVTFNILAPGVVQHEITSGLTYRMNRNNDIDLAFLFAPKTTVTGPDISPGTGNPTGKTVKDWMYQFEVSVGWTYNFGAGSTRAR